MRNHAAISRREGRMEQEDVLYRGAIIHTMDPHAPRAEAMLSHGGRIAAIGSRAELEARAASARCVDLEGAVIPGFNDCHCHILSIGLNLEQVDVSADAVRTIGDIHRAVASRGRTTGPGDWLLGRGYDQNILSERRHPTRQELDTAAPDHPVVLWHTSGHVLAANSQALTLAGIDSQTVNPPGGEIERDEHGEPTGLLKESAMDLVNSVLPVPDEATGASAILRAVEMMARHGITSATDAATGHGPSVEGELAMYRRAAASGQLRGRIGLAPQIGFVAPPDEVEIHPPDAFDVGSSPEWLALHGTKIFSDGAMSTRTAALRRPYADNPDNYGILLWEQATLTGMIRRGHAAGWQIITHALGDRAVEVALDAYESAHLADPRRDHRHRIEHCMLLDETLGRRMKRLGIVPVIQPDIQRLGDGYVAALGLERAQHVIPLRLFERLQVPIAFSSDAPVIPCDPLAVIRGSMERRTPSGVTLGREHAATAMESIRLYTAAPAYATHQERGKGMLRAGMLADFAVLSADPAITPTEDFRTIRVTMTVVNGAISYQAS